MLNQIQPWKCRVMWADGLGMVLGMVCTQGGGLETRRLDSIQFKQRDGVVANIGDGGICDMVIGHIGCLTVTVDVWLLL
jgi:hypothetical protein